MVPTLQEILTVLTLGQRWPTRGDHHEQNAGAISQPSKGDGSRQPSANELAIARFQGWQVAEITQKLGV